MSDERSERTAPPHATEVTAAEPVWGSRPQGLGESGRPRGTGRPLASRTAILEGTVSTVLARQAVARGAWMTVAEAILLPERTTAFDENARGVEPE